MNITNQKKVAIGIFSIFIIAILTAGCLGGDDGAKAQEIKITELNNTTSMAGWLPMDSQGDGGDSVVDESLEIKTGSSFLIEVELIIIFDDFDAEHAESDDGSNPDEYTVKMNSSGIESEIASGSTPGSSTITLSVNTTAAAEGNPEDMVFGPTVTIIIHADCGGGKPYKPFIPGRPGRSPLVYVDQGISYSFTMNYKYLEITQ